MTARGRNAFIGSPVERVEDLRFLRGRGTYVDDLTREGLLHAAVLRSSVPHGRIRAIDASAALAIKGVAGVLTAADIGSPVPTIPVRLHPLPELVPFQQPVIAQDKVRYVGEPLALVVAEDPGIAEDALEAIAVDIEALAPVTDTDAADRGDALLFERNATNLSIKYTARKGDAEAAFRDAPYTRREQFRVHRHSAVPMEARGLLAAWDPNTSRLVVEGVAKVPYFNRRILSQLIGLPEAAIEMVEHDVGGGFGVRGEFYPEDFLIPFAARHFRRPVKWIEDRREHLLATNHARELACDIEIACERDGTIRGLRGQVCADLGAYMRTNGTVAPRNCAQFLAGPYQVENIEIEASAYVTNKTPAATYRGPGRYESDFFRERLLDLVAGDLGIDRVTLRRRNLVRESAMPYDLANVTPPDGKSQFDSGNYELALDRCLLEFDWTAKTALAGKLIDGRYHGVALGCFIEGGAAGPKESARLVVEADGSVSVHVGSSGLGQGLETIMAQIAADALEMPMDRIRVLHGSTSTVREGYGSFHSRSTVMGGSAILLAAASLRREIRAAAAGRLGCAPEEIDIDQDSAGLAGGRRIGLEDLAGVSAEESFLNSRHTYAYGTHAAHVAVDAKTGAVEILAYQAVEDVGRIINPHTIHGQVVGAIVQGLGGTMLEHLVYSSDGQLLTGSLADYLVPTASDFPNIRAVTLEQRPSPINPLGAKGVGEGGNIPTGGVVSNAVASALSSLGVQPRELPLSPARIWELVQSARRP